MNYFGNLDKTFWAAQANCEDYLEPDEQRFLEDMKYERKTSMGGVDKLYEMRIKRQNERKLKKERARLREETYIREHINRNTRGLEIIDEEGELEFSSEFGKRNRMNDSDYEPPKKKKEPEMITIQINPSEWIDSVALVADKTGTSTRTALLHACLLYTSPSPRD